MDHDHLFIYIVHMIRNENGNLSTAMQCNVDGQPTFGSNLDLCLGVLGIGLGHAWELELRLVNL